MNKILIIGGGTLQVPVVKIARELGYTTVVIDANKYCPCSDLADIFHDVDIFNRELALNVARIEAVKGVAAVAIDAEDTAAYVGNVLNLPSPDLLAAETTRDKSKFHTFLSRQNIPSAQTIVYTSTESYETPPFDPPWIVRPANNSASRGVSFVHNIKDLPATIENAMKYCLPGAEAKVLVSEVLPEGIEHSTEIFLIPGEDPVHLNSCIRPFFPRELGAAIEIGHLSPSPISVSAHEILYNMAVDVARGLGIDWGILKIDTLWPEDSNHPYVLEGCLRLSGGCDSTHTYPLVYDRSSVRAFLRLSMNESVAINDPDLKATIPYGITDMLDLKTYPRRYAAAVGYTLPSGRIVKEPHWEYLTRLLQVEEIIPRVRLWDSVEPLIDCAGRAGFVIVTGDNPEEVWSRGLESGQIIGAHYGYSA